MGYFHKNINEVQSKFRDENGENKIVGSCAHSHRYTS